MKSLHGSWNRASCPDNSRGLLLVVVIGRGTGPPVRIHSVLRGYWQIRTRNRTICPDACKIPTWNQESRQFGGIGCISSAALAEERAENNANSIRNGHDEYTNNEAE